MKILQVGWHGALQLEARGDGASGEITADGGEGDAGGSLADNTFNDVSSARSRGPSRSHQHDKRFNHKMHDTLRSLDSRLVGGDRALGSVSKGLDDVSEVCVVTLPLPCFPHPV